MKLNPNGEALVVLPTGIGKSSLISIESFGISKESIVKILHYIMDNFWIKHNVIFDPEDMPIGEEYSSDMLYSIF